MTGEQRADLERIMARIAGVAPDGILSLQLAGSAEARSFAFKEVAACLSR